jgi:uncharacterized membrane-anchored protein
VSTAGAFAGFFAFALAFGRLTLWRGRFGLLVVFAGIRVTVSAIHASPLCVCLFAGIRVAVSAVHASPLCGAAPTFLCRRKEK